MKTLHLTLLLLLSSSYSSFAQFQKGSIYLPPTQLYYNSFGIADGHFSTSRLSEEGLSNVAAALVATGGYALNEQFILWGAAVLGSNTSRNWKVSGLNMQLNTRFYPYPNFNGSNFFVELGVLSQFKAGNQNPWGFQARAGLTHFITNSLALELGAGPQVIEGGDGFQMYTGLAIFLNNEKGQVKSNFSSPIQKGTWILGTGLTNLRILDGLGDPTEISLSPQVAFCLSNQFTTGINFNYHEVLIDGGDVGSSYWSVEPEVRYYCFRHSKAAFYVSGTGGFFENKTVLENHTVSESGTFYGLGLGADIFVKPWLGLEFGPGFRQYLGTDRTRLGMDLGLRVFL